MTREEYLRDPCAASSLPWSKARRTAVPEGVLLIHDTDPAPRRIGGYRDEPYFRLLHGLREIPAAHLPEGFAPGSLTAEEAAAHIRLCYGDPDFRAEDLRAGLADGETIWLAAHGADGAVAASGVAVIDPEMREGALEWIQVSPGARRRGLGRWIVCALLRAMRGRADFATVSGRILAADRPERLYRACGFTGADVWHVCTKA